MRTGAVVTAAAIGLAVLLAGCTNEPAPPLEPLEEPTDEAGRLDGTGSRVRMSYSDCFPGRLLPVPQPLPNRYCIHADNDLRSIGCDPPQARLGSRYEAGVAPREVNATGEAYLVCEYEWGWEIAARSSQEEPVLQVRAETPSGTEEQHCALVPDDYCILRGAIVANFTFDGPRQTLAHAWRIDAWIDTARPQVDDIRPARALVEIEFEMTTAE